MELYKKPVLEIVELEKVDVLTASCKCEIPVDLDSNGICDTCKLTIKKTQP